jgi:NTE family protein
MWRSTATPFVGYRAPGSTDRLLGHKVYNIVHLIYRSKHYECHSKDDEFSRLTMEDHWRAGYHDAVRTLRHQEALERPSDLEGVFTFDLAQASRE